MTDTDARLIESSVTRDLMRKCGDDVAEVIMRSAYLAESGISAAVIATGGAASALGIAAGAFAATLDKPVAPSDAADALWEKLRPTVIRAFQQSARAALGDSK
jgi:hypothetical protein